MPYPVQDGMGKKSRALLGDASFGGLKLQEICTMKKLRSCGLDCGKNVFEISISKRDYIFNFKSLQKHSSANNYLHPFNTAQAKNKPSCNSLSSNPIPQHWSMVRATENMLRDEFSNKSIRCDRFIGV